MAATKQSKPFQVERIRIVKVVLSLKSLLRCLFLLRQSASVFDFGSSRFVVHATIISREMNGYDVQIIAFLKAI